MGRIQIPPAQATILASAKITRRQAGGCPRGGMILVYRIPIRLDASIVPYLKSFGDPAFNLAKSQLLKIEKPQFVITGIKRLKEIRFTYRRNATPKILKDFEEALVKYVNVKGVKK